MLETVLKKYTLQTRSRQGVAADPRVLWPIRLPHAGMLSGRGMLSSAAAKEVTDGSDRARPPAAPKAVGPKPGQKPNPARTAAASVLATVEEAGNRSKPTALPQRAAMV